MSELNDIITKLCPNGVPYRKLDEVAEIKRGRRVVKKELSQDSNSGCPVYQNSLKPLGYHTCSNEKAGTPFVIAAGSAGEIGYSDVDYWGADDCYSIECDDNTVNGRYIYHVLLLKQGRIKSQVRRASIPRLSSTAIKHLEIPVPPIEIQHEVVRILDNFMELEAELEAELAGRIEQYEYYRDHMLDKKNLERMDGKPVEMMKLGDVILNLRTGLNPRKNFKLNTPDATNSYITVRELDGMGFKIDQKTNKVNDAALELILKRAAIKQGDILFSGTGTIGNTALVKAAPTNWGIKEGIYAITPNAEMISQKFLIYLFHTTTCVKWFGRKAMGGAVQSVSMADLKTLSIPVPSLATQKRIVDILDRFDTLTTSLSDGIPAEIAMRREQYEYWRSRILDFPRLPDDAASDGE